MDIFSKVIDVIINQAGYYGIDKNTASKNAEKYLRTALKTHSDAFYKAHKL